jgi:formate hydrogenlyase subunit 5
VTASSVSAGLISVWDPVTSLITAGSRLADLFGTERDDGLLLTAHLAGQAGFSSAEFLVPAGQQSYPALTPLVGAAFWYEREIHDLFGVVPAGHPRLEPLVWAPGAPPLPRHVTGPGLFTIPHGPVRSGVTESLEYLVETPGEDIPHLNMRVFYKHRGIEKRFEGMRPADGVLLAERTEGIASVAHALAYCQAVEQIAGCEVRQPAALVRVLHAELERVACHLDVIVRLADAAGLAVASARFGWHKELMLRLTGQLSGSRFGRGVVVPGGVSAPPQLAADDIIAAATTLEQRFTSDVRLLMGTASFLDRLRRTGPLHPDRAAGHGALGPVGRASGRHDDTRLARPYAAYGTLGVTASSRPEGDALARLDVRVDEIASSFGLVRRAAAQLDAAAGPVRSACPAADGRAVGLAEAPQGEVLYDVRIEDGLITRCRSRSASFHNLVLMHEVFAGDILTDFPFIEASFGLSAAGVSG